MKNHLQNIIAVIEGRKGGGKGGGGGGRTPVEAPNTLQSKTIARVVDCISEGEIKGLVDGAKSIYFDDVALQNSDGTFNFNGVTWDHRVGLPDQSYLPGFPQVEQELSVSVELKYAERITRVISQENVDAVVVKLRIPTLSDTDVNSGDMNPSTVSLLLQYRSQGSNAWITARTVTISGKCVAPYEISYRIDLPKGGNPWEISWYRTTPDSDRATLQNSTYWSTYTAVIDAKLTYPDCAVVGIMVDAEYFGTQVPQRSYDIDGVICNIPDNYDPYTRTYSGLWSGKFKRDWTNNPAWVMYDLLTNARYGLGQDIKPENIDKFGLYIVAQYCDELVDDGNGGKEPRFTFNGVLNTRQEAYNVLTMLAGAFRGMLYFGMGTIIPTQDSPADPKRQFTPANVIDGTFTYEGSALKARHSVVLVSWNDPTDGYRPNIEVVDDPEMISMYGWRPNDLSAFGCTSRGQAHRLGKWTLDSERYETEMCSFSAGLDSADVRPGDIVTIADPHYQGARFGGRLTYVTPDKLHIDSPIDFDPAESYSITLITPDNNLAERKITNTGTNTNEITLASSLDSTNLPQVGSIWVITASNLHPRMFRILSVQETKPNIFAISSLLHDPNKYDRVEKGLILEPPPYTTLPTGPLKPPKNLRVVESLYLAGGLYTRSMATFGWEAPDDPRVVSYEIAWAQGEENITWARVGMTSGLSWPFYDTQPMLHHFRVRGADALGRFTPWVEISVYLLGVYGPPQDVKNFRIQVFGDNANLTWDPVPDLDLARYELRFAPAVDGSIDWASSQVLIHSIPKDASSVTVQAQQGTYYIKAVDAVGVYSAHPAAVINTITPNIFNMNVVALFEQHTAWLGAKDRTEVVEIGGPRLSLTLDPETGCYESEGYYYFNPPEDNIFDLGGVYTSRLRGILKAGGFSPNDDFFDVGDFFDQEDFFDHVSGQWSAILEMRTTLDDPYAFYDFFDFEDFFGSDAIPRDDWWVWSAQWTDWISVTSVDWEARGYQFRIRLNSNACDVTPLIHEAFVEIDMPDRIVSISDRDISSIAGGVRIQFIPPFMATPAVVVAIQEATEGDWFRISNKDRTGFNIEIFDPLGNHVQRSIDGVFKGYGAQADYNG